jgi:hypothetical protein
MFSMLEAGRPEIWEANIDLIFMLPGSPAPKLFAFLHHSFPAFQLPGLPAAGARWFWSFEF